MRRWYLPLHPHYPHPLWYPPLCLCKHPDHVLIRVRRVPSPHVLVVQAGAPYHKRRVYLQHVGPQVRIVVQPCKVCDVVLGGHARKPGHHVRGNLVPGVLCKLKRFHHVRIRVAPVDCLVYGVPEGLEPDLYSRHAILKHVVYVRGLAVVRLGLYGESDVPDCCALVEELGVPKCVRLRPV